MQGTELKQRVDQIEQCTDDAKRAVTSGSATPELRQCVQDMHQQARQLQQACSGGQQQMGQQQMGQQGGLDSGLRQQVAQLEQTADRAMQACRQAGSNVDQQTQQAVQRAHQEISSVKKQMQ
ncbi:hypothetical protein PE066_00565 [Ramlibacter tataouinensis]|uniref:hypothetical protein n=1 Tax=Ramlibacter tataouinensis TaxID=94132 RepID=UPI0022F405C3|nr:hypothetical protein [Ramlibacter tataouinensis]WBY02065.1 hypothetical protein PE066_00565 [Ramlibacter tataouinensis]